MWVIPGCNKNCIFDFYSDPVSRPLNDTFVHIERKRQKVMWKIQKEGTNKSGFEWKKSCMLKEREIQMQKDRKK